MSALIGYRLALTVSTQRSFAPLVVWLVVLSALYAAGVGPPLDGYATTSVVMFPVAAWTAYAVAAAERPVHRQIMVAITQRAAVVHASSVLTVLALVLAFTIVGLAWPVVAGVVSTPSPAELGLGLWAHTVTGLTGALFGLLSAPPLVRKPAFSLVQAGLLLLSPVALDRTPLSPVAPPVLSAAQVLSGGGRAGALQPTLVAVLWTTVLTILLLRLASRRD